MDPWHRIGRIVRLSNIGTLLFFLLNILFILFVAGTSENIYMVLLLYFITVSISLSPIGEWTICVLAGAEEIKRRDIQLRIIPLLQYVLDRSQNISIYKVNSVKIKIIHDPVPNAFAIGRHTICITTGLLELPDDLILGVLAHEVGHLAYGHTVLHLLIGGGNILITGFLFLLKLGVVMMTAILSLFSIGIRSGIMGFITAMVSGISAFFLWLWIKFCKLFLMWSMRQNEFIADQYAANIGFGLELATCLDNHYCDIPRNGLFHALYNSHPYIDERIAALQSLGVRYSRY